MLATPIHKPWNTPPLRFAAASFSSCSMPSLMTHRGVSAAGWAVLPARSIGRMAPWSCGQAVSTQRAQCIRICACCADLLPFLPHRSLLPGGGGVTCQRWLFGGSTPATGWRGDRQACVAVYGHLCCLCVALSVPHHFVDRLHCDLHGHHAVLACGAQHTRAHTLSLVTGCTG